MEKMDGKTLDIVQENINKLKEIFPEVFTEGKIDCDKLKEELGDFIDDREERYSFNWNGKRQAKLIAQTPSTGTLRPCPEESVDWENTKNIFIEGDNLEVLKLLQKSYHKKVKMIYIDPPYNTGHDFVYKDDFKDNIKNYKSITGQLDEEGKNITNNPETSGRYHTDWLNMMYPRLKLARNLLKDDGVIFISIDDNEVSNLRKMCDEIFGEENFIETITVCRSANGMGSKEGYATNHDYIHVYRKAKHDRSFLGVAPDQDYINKFDKEDEYGKYKVDGIFRKKGQGARRQDSPNCFYPVFYNKASGKVFLENKADADTIEAIPKLPNGDDGRWVWSKEFASDKLYRLHASTGGTIYVKDYWNKNIRRKPRSVFVDSRYLTDRATNEIIELFGEKVFSTPKPSRLIFDLIDNSLPDDEIIIDFFAGSGTTAQSLLQHNFDNKHKSKYLLVQIPEKISKDNKEHQLAYSFCKKNNLDTNLGTLAIERIRRAAAKIKEENPEYEGDLGFKVFKLDSTNIKPWEVDFDMTQRELEDYISNIKDDRDEHDILYEVLLKFGLDLTLPITEHMIDGQKVYDIGMGALMVCLSDNISIKVAEGIVALKEELQPEIMRVVFKDSGFADSELDANVVKANILHILKDAGIEDVRSL
ncbi:site-specific DNA-methyltransferase [Deferribacteres bacterium DY0037]